MADGITITPKTTPPIPAQEYSFDEVRPIAGMLGLDVHTLPETDKANIQQIYDFVRADNKEMTEIELLHKVRELEQKLGLTTLGERRVDKLYRYVKLQSQIDNLSKARDRELR